jgi:uncharacterized protein
MFKTKRTRAVAAVTALLVIVAGGYLYYRTWLQRALIDAISITDAETAGTMLARGANANTRNDEGLTALMLAAKVRDARIVNALLDRGADANIKDGKGKTALDYARESSFSGVVMAIIDRCNDPAPAKKKAANMALVRAANLGDAGMVDNLLARDVDVDTVWEGEGTGMTPLMWAIANRHHDIVKKLLDKGSSVNQSSNGGTALLFAVRNNDLELAKVLIQRGADVNYKTSNSISPLSVAEKLRNRTSGPSEMINLLKRAGARP